MNFICKLFNKTSLDNPSDDTEQVKRLLNKLSKVEGMKNVLSLHAEKVSEYSHTTMYTFSKGGNFNLNYLLDSMPFKPYEVDDKWTSRVYITVRNSDLNKYYNNSKVKQFNNSIEELSNSYNKLSHDEKTEFTSSFKTSLEKLVKFMDSMSIVDFTEDNYNLVMEVLNSIKEHQGKIDSTKAEELRKELQMEVEYLKRIKENPLYF